MYLVAGVNLSCESLGPVCNGIYCFGWWHPKVTKASNQEAVNAKDISDDDRVLAMCYCRCCDYQTAQSSGGLRRFSGRISHGGHDFAGQADGGWWKKDSPVGIHFW
jgi:hypothetical protein